MSDRLAEIERREAAATKGPWRNGKALPDIWVEAEAQNICELETRVREYKDDVGQVEADAVFIAHAREDIPWLVAEVKRLREGNR